MCLRACALCRVNLCIQHTRRVGYGNILPKKDVVLRIVDANVGYWQSLIFRASYPLAKSACSVLAEAGVFMALPFC